MIAGTLLMVVMLADGSATPLPTEPVADEQIERARPQGKPRLYPLPPIDPDKVPPPEAAVRRESLPVPDRWRIIEALTGPEDRWDPYHPNTLKGDKPFPAFAGLGPDWFLVLGAVSDSLLELRRLPTPVAPATGGGAGALDIFGQGRQSTLAQTVLLSAAMIKGNTTFKPPDYEWRLAVALNLNRAEAREVRALQVDPRRGRVRNDRHIGLQEAFFDKHLRNVSARYDFDSLRIGIQPFISDFRGFVLQDNALGVRLFGSRDNNRWQYNLGWFRRLEKDTNSGLNDLGESPRDDDTFVANAYRQDWPVVGFTTQASLLHNRNREGDDRHFNRNGFLERPAPIGDARGHDYHVTYLGLSGDGHFGRWNLTTSLYAAFGRDSHQPLAQRPGDIRAWFAAAEGSRDFHWWRLRATVVASSGDSDPFDDEATGFDAILESPQIAGADTSFWIRQAIPLVGGGPVALSGRNGLLPSLRTSKDQGQSNFVNPGLRLFGVGADFDLTPTLRITANASRLAFADTAVLSALRMQGPIDRSIGTDLSIGLQYRPFQNQNLVLNASAAALLPGRGFRQLYDRDGSQYSVLVNFLATY